MTVQRIMACKRSMGRGRNWGKGDAGDSCVKGKWVGGRMVEAKRKRTEDGDSALVLNNLPHIPLYHLICR